MTLFQIIMLAASVFFALKVYEHIQMLQDVKPGSEDDEKEADADIGELVLRGEEAFEAGDMAAALSLFQEADSKERQNSDTAFKIGYILDNSGEKDEALRYYKRALEEDHNNEYIHNSIASIYRSNQEFASARMHLNNSLSINDRNPVTYFNYGNLLSDMKHFEEAIEMYKKALRLRPDFVEAEEELQKLREVKS